jgi:DNA-binding NarL/FixJ family response regulator
MNTILIADDHPLTLMGTKVFVESLGYQVIETCANGIVALNTLRHQTPDIALLDVSMPGLTGLELLEKIQDEKMDTYVILLTMHHEMSVYLKAKQLGVRGYLLKDYAAEELDICIKTVLEGEEYISKYLSKKLYNDGEQDEVKGMSVLTFAERKIVELIALEHSSKEIADFLFISEKTIETHRRNIIQKLNLPRERNALLIWAIKNIKK